MVVCNSQFVFFFTDKLCSMWTAKSVSYLWTYPRIHFCFVELNFVAKGTNTIYNFRIKNNCIDTGIFTVFISIDII